MRRLLKLVLFIALSTLIYYSLPIFHKKDKDGNRYAYVVLNSNKKSLFSTLLILYQLKKNKCRAGKYVIMIPDTLESYASLFQKILTYKIVTYNDAMPLFEPRYSVMSQSTAVRDRILWQKLRAWNITEYETVILLDNDILVRKNIDHLFDLRGVSGVPAVFDDEKIIFWDPNELQSLAKVTEVRKDEDGLNGGLIVLNPNEADFNDLVQSAASYTNRTCCPSQEFIFRHFKARGRFHKLSYRYNMRKLHRRNGIKPDTIAVYHFVERRKPLHLGKRLSSGDTMAKEWWDNAEEFIEITRRACANEHSDNIEACSAFEEVKRLAVNFDHEHDN